jgi:hypothetical protein
MKTFLELQTELDGYTLRTDARYVANRGAFVNGGLRWIQRKLLTSVGTPALWQNAGNVVAGTQSVLVPTDHRPSSQSTLFWLSGDTRVPIRRIPYEYLTTPFYDRARRAAVDLRTPTTQGIPLYFAFRGRVIEIRPAANGIYTLELAGLSYLPALEADGDTNLLTIEAEDCCLYAALRQCWLFFEDAGRVEFWETKAAEAALEWMKDRVHEESGDDGLVIETYG